MERDSERQRKTETDRETERKRQREEHRDTEVFNYFVYHLSKSVFLHLPKVYVHSEK